MNFVDQIKALIAAFALAGTVAGGTVLVGPEVPTDTQLRVAAFNIQVFGKTKRGKPEVMDILVDIAEEFDVMVVQEIRDVTEFTADFYLEKINDVAHFTYLMHEGPRLGRTSSKEQYVVYYASYVELVHAYTVPDPNDLFEREPLVTTLRSGEIDFTLVSCHVKPDHAEAEIRALADLAASIRAANPDEGDIIFMGDLNADGSYLDESLLTEIFPPAEYEVVITDDMITTTKTDNTYDRIILMTNTASNEYISGSGAVFRFDDELGINDHDLTVAVSDHYPVYVELETSGTDDDG